MGDLLKFTDALESHILLDAYYTELLLVPKIDLGPAQYAYGFGYQTANEVTWVGHNGGAPGISADFRTYPELGYTFAVLANYDGAAMLVSRKLETLIARLGE